MIKFVASVFAATLVIVAATLGMQALNWMDNPTYLTEIVMILSLSTILIYARLRKVPANKPEQFIKLYLASIVIKLFLGACLMFLIVLWDGPTAIANGGVFLICYFTFTALEIGFLVNRTP